NVLAVRVYVGEYWDRAAVHDGGRGSQKGARRDDDFVPRADIQGFEGSLQRKGAIGQAHRMRAAGPASEFLLELTAVLARPVVDAVGQDDVADGVSFGFA